MPSLIGRRAEAKARMSKHPRRAKLTVRERSHASALDIGRGPKDGQVSASFPAGRRKPPGNLSDAPHKDNFEPAGIGSLNVLISEVTTIMKKLLLVPSLYLRCRWRFSTTSTGSGWSRRRGGYWHSWSWILDITRVIIPTHRHPTITATTAAHPFYFGPGYYPWYHGYWHGGYYRGYNSYAWHGYAWNHGMARRLERLEQRLARWRRWSRLRQRRGQHPWRRPWWRLDSTTKQHCFYPYDGVIKTEKPGLDFTSKPVFNRAMTRGKLEGETSPVIQLGFLGFTATFFAWLLVIATCARFAQRAFTIQFLFETSQRLIDGLTFF